MGSLCGSKESLGNAYRLPVLWQVQCSLVGMSEQYLDGARGGIGKRDEHGEHAGKPRSGNVWYEMIIYHYCIYIYMMIYDKI